MNLTDALGLMINKPKMPPDEWVHPPRPPIDWGEVMRRIRDAIIPPAGAEPLDPDVMLEKYEEKARKGETATWGDELNTDDVKDAENKIKELGKRIVNSSLRGLLRLFGGR